jgi:hypothetical protein
MGYIYLNFDKISRYFKRTSLGDNVPFIVGYHCSARVGFAMFNVFDFS